ncbi:MAG: GAF domain-containing protein, partial [Staphylococcus epidermidis]|nr:GAF domain-containing protein [Staphylococcus epidermidis]
MEKPTRLALLKEIAEFLNEETEIYSMMQGALRLLINGSDFSTGWIFYIDEEGHHDLVSSVDLPEALSKNHCYYLTNGSCWCVQAYQNHKLTKASNIINCSRINLANHAYDKETNHITHHATVPLQSGSERFGLLNVASPNKEHYSEEDLELLESVAFQIGSAIKRIQLTNKEKENAKINERNRLARDLHDSVNQMLFSLKLTAHAAKGITT